MENVKEKIRNRNYREWAACAFVAPFFLYEAFTKAAPKDTWIQRACSFEIAVGAVFIAYYIYQKSYKNLKSTKPEQEIIEDEIKLLSTARYWYVLPLFVGMFGIFVDNFVSALQNNELILFSGINLIITLAMALGVIYLNEVVGVRELKKSLSK